MIRRYFPEGVLLLTVAGAVFLLTFRAPVSAANSDARYSLLVSLALVEHGTVRLDAYRDTANPPLNNPANQRNLVERNGHLYYYFPLGTPLLATPAVAVARLAGYDLTDVAQQNQLQNGLAALSSAAVWLLLAGLLRLLLPPRRALPLALVIMLGSSLISTLGTALWSHHGAVTTGLGTLILYTGWRTGRWSLSGPLLGLLLFFSFLSRPTMVLLVLLMLALLWRHDRRAFTATTTTAGLLFTGFVLFSLWEYGSWVPPYYTPQRIGSVTGSPLTETLRGLLISPSRGLLVYSPWLLPVVGLAAAGWRRLRAPGLAAALLLWGGGLLLLSSGSVIWWGGHSFGPRLVTDWLPGAALLTGLVFRDVVPPLAARYRATAWASIGLLGAGAVLIHAGSGLYNIDSQRWNGRLPPDVDRSPEIIFDWRYPQFLATADMLCERNRAFVLESDVPAPLPPDTRLAPTDSRVVYAGWALPRTFNYPWLECTSGALLFNLDRAAATSLSLELLPLGGSRLDLTLNGTPLGRFDLPAAREPWLLEVPLPPGALRPGPNELTFSVPEAGIPTPEPPYSLGLGLLGWTLQTGE